jgi:hypothetical protein
LDEKENEVYKWVLCICSNAEQEKNANVVLGCWNRCFAAHLSCEVLKVTSHPHYNLWWAHLAAPGVITDSGCWFFKACVHCHKKYALLSLCPTVCMHQSGSYWMYFCEIGGLVWKYVNIRVLLNQAKILCSLHEDLSTFNFCQWF